MVSSSKLRKIPSTKPTSRGQDGPWFLAGIKVQDPFGKSVEISSLLRGCVVLKVMRRLGCTLTRYEARIMSELRPSFLALGVKVVGVSFDSAGLGEFLDWGHWKWDMYIDQERLVYLALGLRTTTPVSGISEVFSHSGWAALSAARKKSIMGNFSGDSFQLGGTFVIIEGTLSFGHVQTGIASFPSLKSIFSALGIDSETIVEKAPLVCVRQLDMYPIRE